MYDSNELPLKSSFQKSIFYSVGVTLLLSAVIGAVFNYLSRRGRIRYFCLYSVVPVWLLVFCSFVVLPVCIIRPWNLRNLLLASAVCKHISWLIGLRWSLRGERHLAEQRACIVVANHQSSLDILGMFEIWSVMQKCTVVAKKELFYAWPFGLAAWLCGVIFIERANSQKARESINNASMTLKENQAKLWVFPEGTRKNTGEIHPFKKGAFFVALSAQLPIQPVVFSPYYFLNDKERTLNSGRIIISALPPISTVGLTTADVDMVMDKVRNIMIEEFTKISAEMKASLLPPLENSFNEEAISK